MAKNDVSIWDLIDIFVPGVADDKTSKKDNSLFNWDNKTKEKSKYDKDLFSWEKDEVKNNEYDDFNFEEEDTEEDDFYHDDDID